MIQCSDCEHFHPGSTGSMRFSCDPYSNIKEPECLAKWQLIKVDRMVAAYEATLAMHERMGPLQERMMRHMERELDEADEADRWKLLEDEDDEDDDAF